MKAKYFCALCSNNVWDDSNLFTVMLAPANAFSTMEEVKASVCGSCRNYLYHEVLNSGQREGDGPS